MDAFVGARESSDRARVGRKGPKRQPREILKPSSSDDFEKPFWPHTGSDEFQLHIM
jgi:hypothetical protein